MMEVDYKIILENLLHELESLNSTTKRSAEILSKASKHNDREALSHHASIVLENSVLFSTHLDIVNFQVNPNYITDVEKFEKRNIHGQFFKVILSFKRLARAKDIEIKLTGNVIGYIDSKPVIDTLTVLVLDNAIKYSPQGGSVDIEFYEDEDEIEVEVTNLGPSLSKDEIRNVCDRGFRGYNAIQAEKNSRGFGLNFVKFICDIHQAKLDIKSLESYTMINNIPYSDFIVNIVFKKELRKK